MPADQAAHPSGTRLGLALSGGGFRASFFHIGVLARLAELGILRQVEVLSTVSGGSIIGALYYIHVKKLLEGKDNNAITDRDYVDIVERIQREFLESVQKNLRCRVYLDPKKIYKMYYADYSRSDCLGELYDTYIYGPAWHGSAGDQKPIEMRQLKIHPLGWKGGAAQSSIDEGFKPLRDNRELASKVPILVLNATDLNTGHNWRFEASRMGEQSFDDIRNNPTSLSIDKHRHYVQCSNYDVLPGCLAKFKLGSAVAASSCVPGVFHPLSITDLYAEKQQLQLVDGGVHDNQGVDALLDYKCTHIIASDASGQMEDDTMPSTSILSVILRSKAILEDRLRQTQLYNCCAQLHQSMACFHLRTGLDVPLSSCREKPPCTHPESIQAPVYGEKTGVDAKVQHHLSRIRTDLDSFSEIEAYSLMMNGYLVSLPELKEAKNIWELCITSDSPAGKWDFQQVAKLMNQPTPLYLNYMELAKKNGFKVFHCSRVLAIVSLLLALFALRGLANWLCSLFSCFQGSPGATLLGVLLVLSLLCLGGFEHLPGIGRIGLLRKLAEKIKELIIVTLTFPLWPLMWLHLRTTDRLFLWFGRSRRFVPQTKPRGGK